LRLGRYEEQGEPQRPREELSGTLFATFDVIKLQISALSTAGREERQAREGHPSAARARMKVFLLNRESVRRMGRQSEQFLLRWNFRRRKFSLCFFSSYDVVAYRVRIHQCGRSEAIGLAGISVKY